VLEPYAGKLARTVLRRRGGGNSVLLFDFISDGLAITVDLNLFKKKIRKKDLEDKDYKWGYSNINGYYLGFKLTLVIEHPSLVPVAFLIHTGSRTTANSSRRF